MSADLCKVRHTLSCKAKLLQEGGALNTIVYMSRTLMCTMHCVNSCQCCGPPTCQDIDISVSHLRLIIPSETGFPLYL